MSGSDLGPIVSSAHLASGPFPEVSEFEFGLILAGNAFNRWVVRAMSAAGYPDLSSLEVLVLHTVRHRARPKKLADICLVLNIEDTHTVNYAIKKLIKAGLVQDVRQGKEKSVTALHVAGILLVDAQLWGGVVVQGYQPTALFASHAGVGDNVGGVLAADMISGPW